MGVLAFVDRLSYGAWNLVNILFGTPAALPWFLFTMYLHNKINYALYGIICIAYLSYILWQYFSGAAEKSVETQTTGDHIVTYDFYWMNIIILSFYSVACVLGFLYPDSVGIYRSSAAQLGKNAYTSGQLPGIGNLSRFSRGIPTKRDLEKAALKNAADEAAASAKGKATGAAAKLRQLL